MCSTLRESCLGYDPCARTMEGQFQPVHALASSISQSFIVCPTEKHIVIVVERKMHPLYFPVMEGECAAVRSGAGQETRKAPIQTGHGEVIGEGCLLRKDAQNAWQSPPKWRRILAETAYFCGALLVQLPTDNACYLLLTGETKRLQRIDVEGKARYQPYTPR